MSEVWSRLPTQEDGAPALLYRYITDSKGYEVLITDLSYIWSEKLGRKQILQRASKYDTSIDPSEDEDQYSVFLDKVGSALRGSKNTTISLESGSEARNLKLNITAVLPAPLDPLEWAFYLSPSPQNAMSKQILLPLLKEETNREARIKSLIEHLKEKDWALNKLFDKIESSGVDLSTVFPGMAGVRLSRKGSVFAQASKLIKGVAPFDEKSWNAEFKDHSSDLSLGLNIVKELSGKTSPLDLSSDALPAENWWNNLTAVTRDSKPQQKFEKPKKQDPSEQESSDEEFQRQETPPRLRKSEDTHRQETENNVTKTQLRQGTSEDAPARGSPSPGPARSPQKSKATGKGLGSIGSKPKKKRKSPSPEPSEETESEDSVGQQDKPSKKSKGLGSIGGRVAKRKSPSPPPTESGDESEEAPKSTKKAKKKKTISPAPSESTQSDDDSEELPKPRGNAKGLGAIGGRKQEAQRSREESSPEATASDIPSEDQSKKKPTPHHEPTESDEEDGEVTSRPHKRKASANQRPHKPAGGLGQIGGRKKEKDKQKQTSPDESSDDERRNLPERHKPSAKAKKPKAANGKLGIIGGSSGGKFPRKHERPKSPATSKHDDDATTEGEDEVGEEPREKGNDKKGREASPQKPAPRPSAWAKKDEEKREETPEERANRKREELRKQLEAKSQGPAKKKRKF